jgi:hypothetical protein
MKAPSTTFRTAFGPGDSMPTAVYAAPAVFGVISLLLGCVMLFSSHERNWIRVMAFCCLLAALPLLWQASLGFPRPTDLDLAKPSGTVVSYVVDEPKSIFVWLVPDGSKLPRAYSFPFEASKALQLQRAFADARQRGGEIRMEPGGSNKSGSLSDARGNPGQGSADASRASDRTVDDPDFYPVPQRADPLKSETRTSTE